MKIRAAQATAAAWFPADTVTSPRPRSSALSDKILFNAPRALNEPVFWKLSHFKWSRTPAGPASCDADKSGVR